MSFFSNLFNRKEQAHILKNTEDKELLEEEDLEEDPEEESGPEEEQEEITSGASEDEQEYEVVEIEIHPAKIICPDCGGITLEGLEFCDKCGGELQ